MGIYFHHDINYYIKTKDLPTYQLLTFMNFHCLPHNKKSEYFSECLSHMLHCYLYHSSNFFTSLDRSLWSYPLYWDCCIYHSSCSVTSDLRLELYQSTLTTTMHTSLVESPWHSPVVTSAVYVWCMLLGKWGISPAPTCKYLWGWKV